MSNEPIPRSFWAFNIGHVLTLVTFLVAGIGAYYGLKTDLTVVDTRVVRVETTIDKLTEQVVSNARQDERIGFIERRLDRLEALTPSAPR